LLALALPYGSVKYFSVHQALNTLPNHKTNTGERLADPSRRRFFRGRVKTKQEMRLPWPQVALNAKTALAAVKLILLLKMKMVFQR